MLETLAIRNYRSLRDFIIPLAPLNLVTGANGSGKSNVYKALRERRNAVVRARGDNGKWLLVHQHLAGFDSMLSQLADPRRTPELVALRDQLRAWRFYDHFRSDADAPARMPQLGTHTPVLGPDGADLAAALQTIREIGDGDALDDAVADAFPGAGVSVACHDGRFETTMRQQGLARPLKAAELSDGTLRYLLWVAALLSPRPPPLLVLNETETSLHPDLLPALGRLIGRAAERTQVFVVSHARRLIATLQEQDCLALTLDKPFGETTILEPGDLEQPSWNWIPR